MEFTQEFAVIQGALLTLQKKVGQLKYLTHDSNNKEKIEIVVNTLMKTLNTLEVIDILKDNTKLSQISLFLVLNSDLKACHFLMEDANCGHLIDSAPTLSEDIMIDVFCKPMLRKQLFDLIVNCPPFLGVELLDVAATKIKREFPSFDMPCLITITKAVYVKLLNLQKGKCDHKCEIVCVAMKFMNYFTKFLELCSDTSRVGGDKLNIMFLEDFGQMLMASLELVSSCLKFYLDPLALNENILDMYKMQLKFDYGKWHQKSDDNVFEIMHEQLFSVLIVLIAYVTVDVWLGWAELDSKLTSDYTLQKEIAESMYKCNEVLQSVKQKGMKSQLLQGLIPMLSSMASKPRDEDDEIKEADITLILRRISDQSFSQKKWMNALFTKFDDILLKDECVECIKKNVNVIDQEIILIFLEKIYQDIERHGNVHTPSENVKGVFLSAASHLGFKEQMQLLKQFLDRYGVNSHLCSQDYNSKITIVFNTAVDTSDISQDKKYMEFVNLSLQNPLDVITRLLKNAVASAKQAHIMGDILVTLQPFHSLLVDKKEQESCNLLVNLLNEIMLKRSEMEFSDLSFISIATLLANNHAIPVDDFLKNNILPLIHKNLIDEDWSDIILWLETLQAFIDGTVEPKHSLHIPTLLLTLSQVLELSRKSLCSFSCAALAACERAINIITILLESFLPDVNDETLGELQEKIIELVSPMNQFYFFDLWSKCENYSNFTADWKVYLLHWIHMEKCNLQPPWGCSVDLQRKKIIFELAQLLPLCVQSEWQTVAQNLRNLMLPTFCETSSTFVFECLIDAIQIMALLCSSPCLTDKEQDCGLSCLDFCIRNLSTLIKEELTGNPESITAKTASTLFQKLVHLNYVLPSVIKESCAGILLNMQVDCISCALADMHLYSDEDDDDDDEKHIKFQYEEILRSMAISVTMVEDKKTRQALACKLQDGLNIVSEGSA